MRYSVEDRTAHVALWRESGLSKAKYCRENGLPYHSLVAWTKAGRGGPSAEAEFVQLEDDRPATQLPRWSLRVEIGDLSLAFSGEADPEWVVGVLAGFSRC